MFTSLILLFYVILYANGQQRPILPEHSAVDHIVDIETEPTQIVITTSKDGPVEHLRIHIEVIDLDQKKAVNPVDVSGVWLGITRGRYTVPFLRPSTWYGVKFRSENTINGHKIFHEDERLIRTTSREDPYIIPAVETHQPVLELDKVIEVKVHRSLDGVEHYETIFLTASWITANRTTETEGRVHVIVVCDNGETSEDIVLHHDDKSQTIEITMDNKYEIENVNNAKHLVKANIIPLKCHRICWNASLYFVSEFGNFGRDQGNGCQPITPTSATTYLREFKQFKIEENELAEAELVIETELAEDSEDVVTIVATKLGNGPEHRVEKKFHGEKNNGTFRVVLHDDAVYAVQYDYVKSKPFHYTTNTNFLVETPTANSTHTSKPLILVKAVPETFQHNPDSSLKPEKPFLLLTRDAHYNNTNISLNIRSFCHSNETEIVLDDRYPEHQVDVVAVLCSHSPFMYFCDKNSTYPKCEEPICFSTAVSLNNTMYGSEVKCTNVTQHFGSMNHASSITITLLLLSLCAFLFL